MLPFDLVRRSALAAPERPAVRCGELVLSFGDMTQRVDALAAALQELTDKPRPTVAVLSPNTLDLFLAVMAVHACAAVLVPLNYRNARTELDAQIAAARPDVLVVEPGVREAISPTAIPIVWTGTGASTDSAHLEALIDAHRGAQPRVGRIDLTAPNAIKFTGGSSGRPKGVLQSFRCLNTLIASMLLTFKFDADEIYACAAPMTHGAGTFMLPTLAAGGQVVVVQNAKADALAAAMVSTRATAIWVPPTMLYNMIEEQRARPRRYSLRHLIYGGAPTAVDKINEARTLFGEVLEAVYGQTEAPSILTALTSAEHRDPRNHGSAGRACPLSRVAIMGSDGERLPSGEHGEIVASGDLLMNGYLNMPEETAKTLVDGWLHTGDVGYFDERGYLFIKDRIRDVVISGGFNVYPSDIENALSEHAAVRECVVFGAPDAHWGERVEAALELKAGAQATEPELIEFARQRVGSIKAPKRIHIVDTLPRSPVGKVLRREAKVRFGHS